MFFCYELKRNAITKHYQPKSVRIITSFFFPNEKSIFIYFKEQIRERKKNEDKRGLKEGLKNENKGNNRA